MMGKNLAFVKQKAILETAEMYFATVIEIDSSNTNKVNYSLQLSDQSEILALKAESCLLLPEVGDLVLVTSNIMEQQIFILQILNRISDSNVVNLGKSPLIQATNLKFEAQAEISLEAPSVTLTGIRGLARFNHTNLISNWCEMRVEKMRFITHYLERIINTVTEKIGNSFRTIEGIESTKADRIKSIVTGRFFCKAKHVSIDAKEEVSIDGKKINIG